MTRMLEQCEKDLKQLLKVYSHVKKNVLIMNEKLGDLTGEVENMRKNQKEI